MSSNCRVCSGKMPDDRKGWEQMCPVCLERYTKYKNFMLESNTIEKEPRINTGDMAALQYALNVIEWDEESLCHLHRLLGAYLEKPWVGRYRRCNVWVGNHAPPDYQDVPALMDMFFEELNTCELDSWEAHTEFESIHPFQDLNGRVGRLLWLNMAVKEGYNFKIPFLQMYYYQTLAQYQRAQEEDDYV